MRRGTVLFLVLNFVVLCFLVNAFSTLIALLFEDGAADAIHLSNSPTPGTAIEDAQHNLIPKILHQTYINASIPLQWKASQESCVDLHSDYEYKLWTDDLSRNFIAEQYSWFLGTFDHYTFPIQRADVIRYFVLAHYGGVYIDLDDGCNRRLDPLLRYPAWVRRTVPTGISNDVMGSIPQHPFFLEVIKSLNHFNRNWGLPYITVMYSTGPLFLSVVWKEYIRDARPPSERIRTLLPSDYSNHEFSFFKIARGSSWHGKDARTIFWMGRHWLLLTILGFLVAGVAGVCLWWTWSTWVMEGLKPGQKGRRRLGLRRTSTSERYEMVNRLA